VIRARTAYNLLQGADGRWHWRYDAAGLVLVPGAKLGEACERGRSSSSGGGSGGRWARWRVVSDAGRSPGRCSPDWRSPPPGTPTA
jgi:hypothetical protein